MSQVYRMLYSQKEFVNKITKEIFEINVFKYSQLYIKRKNSLSHDTR